MERFLIAKYDFSSIDDHSLMELSAGSQEIRSTCTFHDNRGWDQATQFAYMT
jgi:hypothetical protein